MDIFKRMTFADYITAGNGVCGMITIVLSLQLHYSWAALFLLAAVACDYLDGHVARWLRQSNAVGEQLDSLADIISFGVAPAVFAYQLGANQLWQMAVIIFFVLAGVLRLARFNVTRAYLGMPITMNGIIVPVLFLAGFADYTIYYFIAAIILMLSTIRFRK